MKAWVRWDARITRLTEYVVFAIGVVFTLLVSLEVISRFVFDFSIYFINALSTFLLVWFFLLGAGLAMKYGAHIGFEMLVGNLPRRAVVVVEWFGHLFSLTFLAFVLIGSIEALPVALEQLEPALDVTVFWSFLAIPVGFVLILYHYVSAILFRYVLGQDKPSMSY